MPASKTIEDLAGQAQAAANPPLANGTARSGSFAALRLWLASVRARLLLLIIVALLPTALLFVYSAYREQKDAVAAVENRLRQLTALAVGDFEIPLKGAHYILAALSEIEAIRSAREPQCSKTLSSVYGLGKRYSGFAVLAREGTTQCRTANMDPAARYGDREPFKRVLATRALVVGTPVIGRGSKKSVIPIFFPVLDPRGEVARVVSVGLDLTWIAEQIDKAVPETALTLLIFNSEGHIFYRYPENEQWTGKTLDRSFLNRTFEALTLATLEARGPDGVQRL